MRGFIPTPSVSSLNVGPLTIHFYAACILVGILVAIFIGRSRLPNNADLINDLAVYVIPAGVIGARIYHVVTTPEKYFNSNFIDAFKIWEGGLGIWGAIAGGAAVGFIYLRHKGMHSEFLVIADALAPGIIFAQAIGRFGNWFNGELFGKPSTLPWALEIPLEKRPITFSSFETFHPTFLYEALWCVAIGFILLQIKPKRSGQIFWLYVLLYSIGRALIELIRIDYSNLILGARLNVWVAVICAAVGAWQYLKSNPKKIG